jgi:hypothetical protein
MSLTGHGLILKTWAEADTTRVIESHEHLDTLAARPVSPGEPSRPDRTEPHGRPTLDREVPVGPESSQNSPRRAPSARGTIRVLRWTQIGPKEVQLAAVNGRDPQRSADDDTLLQGQSHQPPHKRRRELTGGQTRDYA